MAPSLQELIDFLLNEVALCGSQGAALSEVLQAIEDFYHSSPEDVSVLRQTVDDRFKAKVWLWLTRNQEVSVGADSEWNHLSLHDVQKLNRRGSVSSQINDPNEALQEQASSPIRIFVSKERSWYAVTGHEPDESKVPASEFVLLSIIASRKSKGIPQTDLVRLSGQDKRSVPKRTDALQKKGYIDKRPVQVKAARTSLLTLYKFLKSPSENTNGQSTQNHIAANDTVDFKAFTKKIFEILKEHNGIVARNDLKKLLGFEDRWRWRILSRALRKLERIGVTKRVKAASQYEKLHPCVMLLREPTEKDMQLFNEFKLESFGGLGVDDQGELDEDMELDADQGTPGTEKGDVQTIERRIVDASRTVPSWNPDRNIHNHVFDIIDNAGNEGITNININRALFGMFYRRPTENLIHRLVDCWQVSQPPHLRHLAVVRDTAIEKTTIFYIHYSAKNFAKQVEAGTASWEAVEFPAKKAKSANFHLPPVDATAQLDENGLRQEIPRGIVKNGKISLLEGLMVCKPTDYTVTSSDPTLCRYPNGSVGVVPGHIKSQGGEFPGVEVPHEDTHGLGEFSTPARPGRGRRKAPGSQSARAKGKQDKISSEMPDRLSTEPTEEKATVEDEITMEADIDSLFRARKKPTKAKDKFKHLPRKERFEALGMDETWTEYKALTMEKPTPGVYVTPQGKRRPVGKKQGRPSRSRIAVFKSQRLHELPWFVKEDGASDDEGTGEHEDARITPVHSRTAKRDRRALDSDFFDPSIDGTEADGSPQIARKRLRLEQSQSEEGTDRTNGKLPELVEGDGHDAVSGDQHKRPARPQEAEEVTTPKRPRLDKTVSMSPGGDLHASPGDVAATPTPQPMGPPHQTPKLRGKGPTKKKSAPTERGGSVSILRRKIIMGIVEKAGGAYPSGNEIWYPFTTKWKQASRKETPDMRTIKTAIKCLVDAGKLRQLTYSGKDSNGMMVTRTILTMPEISPEDPVVKEMQAKQLASKRADHKTTYSSNIDTDPEITRANGPTGVHKYTLPLVTGATVQLQTKPASVRAEERRQERKIQRELMKRLERERQITNPGVRRLMTIQRHSYDPSANLRDSINLPTMVVKSGQPHTAKRLVKKMSTISWYSMSMNPQQRYHPVTGTFGTFSTFAPDLGSSDQGLFQVFKTTRSKFKFTRAKVPTITPSSTEMVSITDLADLAHEPESFHSRNDRIANWEIGHQDLFDGILAHHPFIEQGINDANAEFHPAPTADNICFAEDRKGQAAATPKSSMVTRRRNARLQSVINTGTMGNDLEIQTSTPPTLEPLPPLPTPLPPLPPLPPPPAAPEIPRRQRNLRPLSESLTRKLMVAIVAVRTLAGGLEGKIIDWDLIKLAFPNLEGDFVRRSANRVIVKSRLEILRMQSEFQERYLEAYAEHKVPFIDYNRLDQYDWPAVVEWASTELDFSSSDKLPSLPATREQFDSIFELREEPVTLAQELYKTTTGSTLAYKRDLMARTPFAVPLDSGEATKPKTRRQEELAQIDVVKTWVRANVITPDALYDPVAASKKLATFGNQALTNAAQHLLNENVIIAGNRGRTTPGRNYETHDFFRQQLDRKRAIDRHQLRRAAEFKMDTLDSQFREKGSLNLDYHAADGDVLALVNLFANQHIDLSPVNAPRQKFGLLNGSYLTRQMDKTLLRFEVEIRPLPSYVYGNPMKERIQAVPPPSAPQPEGSELQRKIPLWFAIGDGYGQLLPDFWERAVAAVVGCVDTRPGIGPHEISKMVRPILGAWEIELVLNWLTEVGLADRHAHGEHLGWTLREWWWMVLG